LVFTLLKIQMMTKNKIKAEIIKLEEK
jgi:hypothetical protein